MGLSLRRVCAAILLFLAFSKSLTLPVLFPLKIYEPLLLLALAAAFAEGRIDIGPNARFIQCWFLFWLLSLLPTVHGTSLVLDADRGALLWAQGRYDPNFNAFFHTAYLALDILALVVFSSALRRGQLRLRDFCRLWTLGAIVAVVYAIALNLFQRLGLPLSLLGRFSDPHVMHLPGIELVRNGPFEEGNYFGLYLVLSYGLCLWSAMRFGDRMFRRAPIVLALGCVISASPAALGCLGVLLLASLKESALPRAVRSFQLVLLACVSSLLLWTPLLHELVLEKFSMLIYGGVTDSGNVSLVQRLNEMHHAWRLFLAHPFGIGIGNFGYFYGEVPDLFTWLNVDYGFKKQIPNMVYLEILCEQGIQGLLLFLLALYALLAPLAARRERLLWLTGLCMLAYLIVFPTFRLVFLWVFWAFLVHVGGQPEPALNWARPVRSGDRAEDLPTSLATPSLASAPRGDLAP